MIPNTIVPKFEVEKLSGTRMKKVYRYVTKQYPNGREYLEREETEIEVPAGNLVYTTRGKDSRNPDVVRVSDEELKRMGLDTPAGFIDENGEDVPIAVTTIKSKRGN